MTELLIRALFLLVSGALGYRIAGQMTYGLGPGENPVFEGILVGLLLASVIMGLEILLRRRPIQSISAVIFGIVAGVILAWLLGNVSNLVVDESVATKWRFSNKEELVGAINLCLLAVCCFICVSLVYGTRDRFRTIIPYVEFRKEEKGAKPILLDTSAIIDGRLGELCNTHIFDTVLLAPKFVLQELQHVADSPDKLRRNRGRRGMEILSSIQRDDKVEVQIHDGRRALGGNVDSKLLSLAGQLQCRILTCDYNLTKIAELQGIEVINLNDLASALRPIALQGEEMTVKIVRGGDEAGQGVGYLPDGSMVVVENARDMVNQTVNYVVTNTLQTSGGRMIFGRIRDVETPAESKKG